MKDGRRVVVTRAHHQAHALVADLERRGLRPVPLPLLEIVPPADARALERAVSELSLYDWLVFTSANGVEALLPHAGGALPPRLRVAAAGSATSEALRAFGVEPDVVAAQGGGGGLLPALTPMVMRSRRLLLPLAADARSDLQRGLEAAGAEVVRVEAYAKRLPAAAARQAAALFADGPLGWVTFTSPSIVRTFVMVAGPLVPERSGELSAASLGPTTTAALRTAGIEPAVEASATTDVALAAAIAERATREA
jgi:uroporphyrinogen-III synthase